MGTTRGKRSAYRDHVLRTLLETLFPDPAIERRYGVAIENFADRLNRLSPLMWLSIIATVYVVDFSPILLFMRAGRFSTASLDIRTRVAERLDKSALLGLVMVGLKTLLTIDVLDDPDLLRELGYPGEARKRYLSVR